MPRIKPLSTDIGPNGKRRRAACCGLLLLLSFATRGADLESAQKLFLSGQYSHCAAVAEAALNERPRSEDWQVLLIESLLAVGRYPDALSTVSNALERTFPGPRICWVARETFLRNGRVEAANALVDRILQSASDRGISDAASFTAVGRAALLRGVEPKLVLDRMFDAARKVDPDSRAAYLAIGDLALDKHDYALAARTFQDGLKQRPDDPDLLLGLAKAYEPSRQTLMVQTLEAALKQNSNHVGSLLLMVDHALAAEAYAEASAQLDRIQQINPWHPDAWSYRAVLADLQNQPDVETAARENALKFWPTNPRVPYLIGLKLSQKYRFAEGSALQRQALRFDPAYLPAKVQLAQDLLRLGKEAEGWRLADEVQKADGYDVTANNLMSLHDTMQQFEILTNRHFVLRMTPHEAALYGTRALALLERAHEQLSAKYSCTLARPTLVEVFTNQADFAVRTFAMPQNDGFLGVCFGDVITANSPGAYPGHPFNWEAMLWHEFGHVITLNLTQNKMPRWLSEGISVYEERQANPTWGEHLNPHYRAMMLGDELTPISDLSAAFLMPKSGEHLQFAYYESSLVVQFLVERFGFNNLLAILHDLGDGAEINAAIAKHTVPMDQLEKDFATYAKRTAEQFGQGLDWEEPGLTARVARRVQSTEDPLPWEPPGSSPDRSGTNRFSMEPWAATRPTNFYALSWRAGKLANEKKWTEAKPILQQLIKLCPEAVGTGSAYELLAAAHRALGETNAELKVLNQWAGRDCKASDAYLRLMELAHDANDWPAVVTDAQRFCAVNPLVPAPYRFLAEASEKTGDNQTAIDACRALLQLDPPDPSEVHYHLASLLHRKGDPGARRQVLLALEEAPRYHDALRLLLEINKDQKTETSTQPVASP